MIIGPGVTLVDENEADAQTQYVLDLYSKPLTSTYVVDTFYRSDIITGDQLMMAVIDSMEIPEWFGYHFTDIITHQCIARPGVRVVLILVLTPRLLFLLKDMNLIYTFVRASILTQGQFEVLIFTAPVARKPKM